MSPVEPATAFRDHYAVLGVDTDADETQIKAAFWELAKRHHPDMNGGGVRAARRFAEISEAKTVLLSPLRRAHFDRERAAFLRTGVHVPLAPRFEVEPAAPPRHARLGRALLLAGAVTVLLTVLLLPLASLQGRPEPAPVHAFDPGVIGGIVCCAACLVLAALSWPAWGGGLSAGRWEALLGFVILWLVVVLAGQVDPHLLVGGLYSSDLTSAGGSDALVLGVGAMLGGAALLHPGARRARAA